MTVSLHWFRRDLRLADNPALRSAVASADTVFAVYCADELAHLNARQRAFACAALQHVKLLILDGKFQILHLFIVSFQNSAHRAKLVIGPGHLLL